MVKIFVIIIKAIYQILYHASFMRLLNIDEIYAFGPRMPFNLQNFNIVKTESY